MGDRKRRRAAAKARLWAERLFARHLRHNRNFAEAGPRDCIIILDNLKPSFNVGKIFRSGDAFGIREIHLVGIDYFDAKSAKGSFKYVPASFHNSFAECYELLMARGYTLFVLEPEAELSLSEIQLPHKSAFIFGHEEFGISFVKDEFDGLQGIFIPQVGKVNSLNVAVAASVVMYEYVRQHP